MSDEAPGLTPADDSEAVSIAFIRDRLLTTVENALAALADPVDELEDLGPRLLLLRRNLRLYAAGVASGLMASAQTLNERASEEPLASNEELRTYVGQLAAGQAFPTQLSEHHLVDKLQMSDPRLLNAGLTPRDPELNQRSIQTTVAVASWFAVDHDLLSFALRGQTLDDDSWQNAIEQATSAFIRRYNFCFCDDRSHHPRHDEGRLPRELEETSDWLFNGAPRLVEHLADDAALLEPIIRTATATGGTRRIRESYAVRRGVKGPVGPIVGLAAIWEPSDRRKGRVVEALRLIWPALRRVLPPPLHDQLVQMPPSWSSTEVAELLRASEAPFAMT